jgi:predicted secreted Zn-dependent protease
MRKAVLSFLFVFITIIQPGNLIPWSADKKLTWDDFKGPPDPHSSNAALTSSNINIEFGYNEKGFQYSIKCNFDMNRSWVRIRNSDVLVHEQGHFNIAEIFARKLNKVMKGYQFNAKTAQNDLNKLYSDVMKEHRETQVRYDQETDYSRNKQRQEEWLKKIAGELEALKDYANYK